MSVVRNARWYMDNWHGKLESKNLDPGFAFKMTPGPDGHPKLLHLWPVKLLQAGRSDYDGSGVMAMRAAASFRR